MSKITNAVIIHGRPDKDEFYGDDYPSASNFHWIPWLQKELTKQDILTDTPEMLQAWRPDYQLWKQNFERFNINECSLLVGHSTGGGFILQWLQETQTKVSKVILVAPWIGTGPDAAKEECTGGFFDFELSSNVQRLVDDITIFESTSDMEMIKNSISIIADALPAATIRTFENHGHFCLSDLGTEEFPELLEVCLD